MKHGQVLSGRIGGVIAAAVALAGAPDVVAQDRTPARQIALDRRVDGLRPGQFVWRDSGFAETPVTVVVNLTTQRAYAYRGDTLIGAASVSTGSAGHRTPAGDFTILQKQVFHRSNLYSNAPMPYMQRLTWDGIALHAGHDPGWPASHGCIRLPHGFAMALYAVTSIGAPVTIVGGSAGAPRVTRPPPVIVATMAFDRGAALVTWRERSALHVGGDEAIVPDARLRVPS